MSWKKHVTIYCDGEDCNNWEAYGSNKVSEARDALNNSGWTYNREEDKDYCPECSKEVKK